jgi:hypothetical protein
MLFPPIAVPAVSTQYLVSLDGRFELASGGE